MKLMDADGRQKMPILEACLVGLDFNLQSGHDL